MVGISLSIITILSVYGTTVNVSNDPPVQKAQAVVPPKQLHAKNTELTPRSIKYGDRADDGTLTMYESCGVPPSMAFRTGYFGMPIVIAPYEFIDKKMQMIVKNSIYKFKQVDLGFNYVSMEALPAPPPEPHLAHIENSPVNEIWTKEAQLQASLVIGSLLGYQLDEDGNIYWIGSTAIYVHESKGWRPIHHFEDSFVARRKSSYSRTGVVVLPNKRIALFGGSDYFIRVIEVSDNVDDATTIKKIGYDALGCDADNYPAQAGPQFCISSGMLYFHLRKTGHLFKMDLSTYSIRDLDVPWMQMEFAKHSEPVKWKNTNGSTNVSNPVVPDSMAFAVDLDGSVSVIALMFNMQVGAMHCFKLEGQDSTIHSVVKIGKDILDPILYQNKKGDFVPINSLAAETVSDNKPNSNEN